MEGISLNNDLFETMINCHFHLMESRCHLSHMGCLDTQVNRISKKNFSTNVCNETTPTRPTQVLNKRAIKIEFSPSRIKEEDLIIFVLPQFWIFLYDVIKKGMLKKYISYNYFLIMYQCFVNFNNLQLEYFQSLMIQRILCLYSYSYDITYIIILYKFNGKRKEEAIKFRQFEGEGRNYKIYIVDFLGGICTEN